MRDGRIIVAVGLHTLLGGAPPTVAARFQAAGRADLTPAPQCWVRGAQTPRLPISWAQQVAISQGRLRDAVPSGGTVVAYLGAPEGTALLATLVSNSSAIVLAAVSSCLSFHAPGHVTPVSSEFVFETERVLKGTVSRFVSVVMPGGRLILDGARAVEVRQDNVRLPEQAGQKFLLFLGPAEPPGSMPAAGDVTSRVLTAGVHGLFRVDENTQIQPVASSSTGVGADYRGADVASMLKAIYALLK